MKTLILDNYDSFTFNLYQMIAVINGEEPLVIRNDQLSWSGVQKLAFDNIVISPGPGRPEKSRDFGVCQQALMEAKVPLLGVCLGHQGLGHLYGATVTHSPEAIHGRLSPIYHDNSRLFKGIPQKFMAVRYHSLMVADKLPNCLQKIAWTEEGIIMGLCHRKLPLWGVQFHPESICTEQGWELLQNFRDITYQLAPTKHYTTPIDHSVIPASRQVEPDGFEVHSHRIETFHDPEQVFVHFFGSEATAFWLDSSLVEPQLSRFSFMGGSTGPLSLLVKYNAATRELIVTENGTTKILKESIFDYLARELHQRRYSSDDLPFKFNCGFVGYFGYELKQDCGANLDNPSSLPDAMFLLADQIIVFDHQEKIIYLVCLVRKGEAMSANAWFDDVEQRIKNVHQPTATLSTNQMPITFHLRQSYKTYLDNIRQSIHYINEGETYEVCLTNQIYTTDITFAPLALYRTLRHINPAPYAAFLRFGEIAILSSSPERFLLIDHTGRVESKPIKGTSARGRTSQEDDNLRTHLRNNIKDRAENLMIVDLIRNDLGLVCKVGTVSVPKLMDVETYQTVHQLVSTICGSLRQDMSTIDCIRGAFPAGSMTGAPKLRTMEILDKLEQEARGVYSGAIGFLGLNGTVDLSVVIRTIVMTPESSTLGVGGAIVALSDPESEFDETLLKAQALIQSIILTTRGNFDASSYESFKTQLKQEGSASF